MHLKSQLEVCLCHRVPVLGLELLSALGHVLLIVFIDDKLCTSGFYPSSPSTYPATCAPLVPVFELFNELIWELPQVKKPHSFLHQTSADDVANAFTYFCLYSVEKV